jgi:hypothetical protein
LRDIFQTIAPPYKVDVGVYHEPAYYSVVVAGTILDRSELTVGNFAREIKRLQGRPLYTKHARSEVDRKHQHRGIITSHLRAIIPYYVNTLRASIRIGGEDRRPNSVAEVWL